MKPTQDMLLFVTWAPNVIYKTNSVTYLLSYFLNALVKQQPVEIKVSVDAFIIAQ